jgi:hypothetical protein
MSCTLFEGDLIGPLLDILIISNQITNMIVHH